MNFTSFNKIYQSTLLSIDVRDKYSHFSVFKTRFIPVRLIDWCTPGMGVILWGASSLYVNSVTVVMTGIYILAESKGDTARDGPQEVGAQVSEQRETPKHPAEGPNP